MLDAGADPADPKAAETAARALRPADLERSDLRGPVADAAAASVAAIPGVRAALLDFQRSFGGEHGAVLDGRDIGTVIFPDAPAKLFVTASLAERARRRWLELQARGVAADPATVEAEMLARDTRDAPNMRQAPDAFLLDTTTSMPRPRSPSRSRRCAGSCARFPRLRRLPAYFCRHATFACYPQPGPRLPRARRVSATETRKPTASTGQRPEPP